MPTYEYRCLECDECFERFQKMTDPAVKACPACGGGVRKLMHPPAIAFKGPGFYVNDYKNGNTASSAGKPASKRTEKVEAPKVEKKEPVSA